MRRGKRACNVQKLYVHLLKVSGRFTLRTSPRGQKFAFAVLLMVDKGLVKCGIVF